MQRFAAKMSLAVSALAAVLALASTTAVAQTTDTIEGGRTSVTLSSTFVNALGSLGLTPGTVNPTRLVNGVVDFPITSGAIELDNASAQILHSGGLTLTKGSTKVVLESFIIDTTGSAPVITGLVVDNGKLLGRVQLFDLALPSDVTLPLQPECGSITLNGVVVTLDGTAASALNGIFNANGAFTSGFPIGTAQVIALVPRNYPCTIF
jgi:hypothetical protein